MYRINHNNCSSPRDRLDERLLERLSEQRASSCRGYDKTRVARNCGCNNTQTTTAPVTNNSCECEYNEYASESFNYSLAMVYSPYQEWQNIYCEEEGFVAGTIFKELDKPFYGPKCSGGNCYE